jgi:NADPH:quinone reductase-like Zn-dependent oxidoreductase
MPNENVQNLALRSTITSSGRLSLSVTEVPVESPGHGEVLVKVEAVPINPSDLLNLLGPAELSTIRTAGSGRDRVLTATVPESRLAGLKWRLDKPVAVGNEGAGTVVRAGSGLEHLLGKRVSALAGGMFCQYRTMPAEQCMVLPDGASALEGAALSVNPLTALAMIETLRREGHRALVHTAAASNLGQMLVRICQMDGIDLVNVVRSQAQVDVLQAMGARYVCSSAAGDFRSQLTAAVGATGATLAFDAVGGGRLGHQILRAMETAAGRGARGISYSTEDKKQLYVYGRLDRSALELDWDYGTRWSVGIFVMTNLLNEVGAGRAAELRERIVRERNSTFASHYAATIGLFDLLDPPVLGAINKMATGQKHLLDPTRPLSNP